MYMFYQVCGPGQVPLHEHEHELPLPLLKPYFDLKTVHTVKSEPNVKLRNQQSRSRGGHLPLLFGGLESIVPFGQSKCAVERCA